MKRLFVDLHLCPPVNQIEKVRSLVEKSAELGYNAVGLTLPIKMKKENIDIIRKICEDLGLDFVTRIDLAPKRAKELLNILKRIRRKFEVIAVQCNTKEVAIQAAKDRRVDLLLFSSNNPKRHFFSDSEAKLASEKNSALEINLAPLLYLEGAARIRLMKILRRDVLIARKFGVPIVLSSGCDSPHLLRKPEDYAFLAYLIGLDPCVARESLSSNPMEIIKRNRRKLSPNYVCPGVYIVKRGEDC